MEEAAIRFANGDAAGAEANLRELLDRMPDQPYRWMMLFDFCRATGQQQQFEVLALDYAVRFHQLAPLWCSLPEMTGELLDAQVTTQQGKLGAHLEWRSPAVLDALALASLSSRLTDAAEPWQRSERHRLGVFRIEYDNLASVLVPQHHVDPRGTDIFGV